MANGNEGEADTTRGVDMDDLQRWEKEATADLHDRQNQFGAMIGVDSELLRGLRYCHVCLGENYQWDDICFRDLGDDFAGEDMTWEDYRDYRNYRADSECPACDGSGWEDGDFNMTTEEWVTLSLAYLERYL